MTHRYVYLGARPGTDPRYVGQECDPVRRPDGRVLRARGNQLVRFSNGDEVVVVARRLRLTEKATQPALLRSQPNTAGDSTGGEEGTAMPRAVNARRALTGSAEEESRECRCPGARPATVASSGSESGRDSLDVDAGHGGAGSGGTGPRALLSTADKDEAPDRG